LASSSSWCRRLRRARLRRLRRRRPLPATVPAPRRSSRRCPLPVPPEHLCGGCLWQGVGVCGGVYASGRAGYRRLAAGHIENKQAWVCFTHGTLGSNWGGHKHCSNVIGCRRGQFGCPKPHPSGTLPPVCWGLSLSPELNNPLSGLGLRGNDSIKGGPTRLYAPVLFWASGDGMWQQTGAMRAPLLVRQETPSSWCSSSKHLWGVFLCHTSVFRLDDERASSLLFSGHAPLRLAL
jgi:hypothetical protein